MLETPVAKQVNAYIGRVGTDLVPTNNGLHSFPTQFMKRVKPPGFTQKIVIRVINPVLEIYLYTAD
jgi:hypothetical protein